GNLDAQRDWGYAKDYVDGMWRMLQAEQSETYVLATGRTETVREFVQMAGKAAGFEIEFEGRAEAEVGRDRATGKILVRVNPEFYRPSEVDLLIGDPTKARQ
ncbi:GDP-mannose 4,6-dehydratase, partial [Arthrospira platensis SPKY1]|nr:GDP-mannose 4,6-dehydratase [Arthrospira platensis SPKY1]